MPTIDLALPLGSRVFVVADLMLQADPTSLAPGLTEALDSWDGPGAVVVAGGLIPIDGDERADATTSVASRLRACPALCRALGRFDGAEHRTVSILPGSRDVSDDAMAGITEVLPNAVIAGSLRLRLATGLGEQIVHVEPGGCYDTQVRSVGRADQALMSAPAMGPDESASWLSGVDRLSDVRLVPRFIASRVVYRRVLRWWWLLLVPFAFSLLFKVSLSFGLGYRLDRALGSWSDRLGLLALTTSIDLLLVLALGLMLLRRGWSALVGPPPDGSSSNDLAREQARRLVAEGAAGLVTGHSRVAELAGLGRGFYANPGVHGVVLAEREGRLGLPPVFVSEFVHCWVELDAGAELHVRMLAGRTEAGRGTFAERLAGRRFVATPHPKVVAHHPGGPAWPLTEDPLRRSRTIRRRAGFGIALAGALDLVSAIRLPFESRLQWLLRLVPLAVPQVATAIVALVGIGLLFLAAGVRRGQHTAWRVAVALIGLTVVLHVVKGGNVEDSVVAAVIAAYLVHHRAHFTTGRWRLGVRRQLLTTVVAIPAVVVASAIGVEVVTAVRHVRVSVPDAFAAVAERMIGLSGVALPRRLDQFLSPTLMAVGMVLGIRLAWLVVRPAVIRRGTGLEDLEARSVVRSWASGTLDYFALRSDKEYFFDRSSVVAYAVHHGVCLVSPDPIGPDWERDAVWVAFRRFVDRNGWSLAVLGASAEWLPTYEASGMHDMYVGDEGIIDLGRFSLDGGRMKGLRQAVNRVARNGYTMSFHDPLEVGPALRDGVLAIMDKSRRGDVERGFSMTLGRVFDEADQGLLLAVCHDPDGVPVAFCQYVPAPGINGYSLDLMRRDQGERPNGILDFVIVETVRHLRQRGMQRLGLNFATMRAVISGEVDDTVVARVERWALMRMSGSMQIESLWRFNAKFDPDWQPRYLVYDTPEHLVPVVFAVARAESFWELPLIGRWLTPPSPRATEVS